MNHKVTIELRSVQSMEGEREEHTQTYRGRLRAVDGEAVLQYMMEEETGRVHTTLTLKETSCLMDSRGARQVAMEFIPGKKTDGTMRLSFGELKMEIRTKRYEVAWKEGREPALDVNLVYELSYEKEAAAEHHLQISVRPIEQG